MNQSRNCPSSYTKLEKLALDHTENVEACKLMKDLEQNEEVAPCRFPHVDPHAEKCSLHPSNGLTGLERQWVRGQDEWNSSSQLEQMFHSSQFLQPMKRPWPQVVPYAYQ